MTYATLSTGSVGDVHESALVGIALLGTTWNKESNKKKQMVRHHQIQERGLGGRFEQAVFLPVSFFFFSCLATLGVCDLTLPARAKEPWTLP